MWASPLGSIGVQRKEFPGDFLSSMTDGRLSREVGQMGCLNIKVLALEGRGVWSIDGKLMHGYGQEIQRTSIDAFLLSMQLAGVWVVWLESQERFVEWLGVFERWTRKAKHSSIMKRPGPVSAWGKPSSREYQVHLLSGVPGLGPELAERILDHFGGLPIGWTVDKEELEEVFGIGKKKAAKMWDAIGSGVGVNGSH